MSISGRSSSRIIMSRVQTTLCLHFKLSLPYSGESRCTDDFVLLDHPIHFELKRLNLHYEINLITGSKELFKDLSVKATAYIRHPTKSQTLLVGQEVTLTGNKCLLWVLPVKMIMEQFPLSSKLKIMVDLTGLPVTTSDPSSGGASASQVLNLLEADDGQQRVNAFSIFLQNPEWADSQLVCNDGRMLPAHSMILRSKSPYFKRALKGQEIMEVKLDNVDLETMTHVLRYMYVSETPELNPESTCSLLNAAERLEVPGLREKCWDWFEENVNEENFITFLLAAHSCKCTAIKDGVISYIFHHQEVFEGDLWNDFVDKNNPAIEVLQRIVSRQHSPS